MSVVQKNRDGRGKTLLCTSYTVYTISFLVILWTRTLCPLLSTVEMCNNCTLLICKGWIDKNVAFFNCVSVAFMSLKCFRIFSCPWKWKLCWAVPFLNSDWAPTKEYHPNPPCVHEVGVVHQVTAKAITYLMQLSMSPKKQCKEYFRLDVVVYSFLETVVADN